MFASLQMVFRDVCKNRQSHRIPLLFRLGLEILLSAVRIQEVFGFWWSYEVLITRLILISDFSKSVPNNKVSCREIRNRQEQGVGIAHIAFYYDAKVNPMV
jgi:hypothetical protein